MILCYLKRVQNVFFYKGGPPKNENIWEKNCFHIFLFKNIHFEVLCCEMAEIREKNNRTIAVKRFKKRRILKNGIRYFSSWSNVCLDSKFQAALMFNG